MFYAHKHFKGNLPVRGVEEMYGTHNCICGERLADGVPFSELPLSQSTNGLILCFANCEVLQYLISRKIVLKTM